MGNYFSRLEPKEYFRRYLQFAPLALAIFRAIEANNIAGEEMNGPLLDIGCGFGEFARAFFESSVEMGLDISWKDITGARKIDRYKTLTCADARSLPYNNNYFNTVLSVSVLEHIEGADEVVKEVFRVLKPGGKFIFTANTERINEMLYWPKVFHKINSGNLEKQYSHYYNRLFKHQSLWSVEKWQHLLATEGFEIKICREIICRESTELFDLFLITAWPPQLIKLLIGRRWTWRPQWFREWLVGKYLRYVEEDPKDGGSNLFVVAVKPKDWKLPKDR